MAEKEPPAVKIIQVKPSEEEDDLSAIRTGKNENAVKPILTANNDNSKFFPVKPPINEVRIDKLEKSFRDVELTISNHIQDMFLAKVARVEDTNDTLNEVQEQKEASVEVRYEKRKKKKKNKKRKNSILPLDETTLSGVLNGQTDESIGVEADVGTDKKKKSKETKSEKTKKKKENKAQVKEDVIKGETSETEEKTDEDVTGNTKSPRKLPCLFGFISTWLAKRKERRRDKKRKAIASRVSPQRLVEYDHRAAKGGEAFTVEVDNRPICLKKPLLPPIKQTPGPIRHGSDYRHQNAVCMRAEKLSKRQDSAREYEKKKTRCKERKAENDYQFRHKADLSIKQKQACAERNRDIRSRCKSRMIRTPSTESFNEPSAESSLGSIHGPSCYSEEEYDRDVWDVDNEVDIPIF